MSTIVYRDGVMAADTRAYAGDSAYVGQKRKIRRFEDGSLAGVSTRSPGLSEELLDWVAAGAEPDDFPEMPETGALMLLVKPNGEIYLYLDRAKPSGPLSSEFGIAIGSGDDYATGALRQGATAVEAATIAAELDPWSALPLYVLTHDA